MCAIGQTTAGQGFHLNRRQREAAVRLQETTQVHVGHNTGCRIEHTEELRGLHVVARNAADAGVFGDAVRRRQAGIAGQAGDERGRHLIAGQRFAPDAQAMLAAIASNVGQLDAERIDTQCQAHTGKAEEAVNVGLGGPVQTQQRDLGCRFALARQGDHAGGGDLVAQRAAVGFRCQVERDRDRRTGVEHKAEIEEGRRVSRGVPGHQPQRMRSIGQRSTSQNGHLRRRECKAAVCLQEAAQVHAGRDAWCRVEHAKELGRLDVVVGSAADAGVVGQPIAGGGTGVAGQRCHQGGCHRIGRVTRDADAGLPGIASGVGQLQIERVRAQPQIQSGEAEQTVGIRLRVQIQPDQPQLGGGLGAPGQRDHAGGGDLVAQSAGIRCRIQVERDDRRRTGVEREAQVYRRRFVARRIARHQAQCMRALGLRAASQCGQLRRRDGEAPARLQAAAQVGGGHHTCTGIERAEQGRHALGVGGGSRDGWVHRQPISAAGTGVVGEMGGQQRCDRVARLGA